MRKKRVLWLTAGLLTALLLACIGSGGSLLPTDEAAPDFGIKVGDEITYLSDYQGQVVVLNFWSST